MSGKRAEDRRMAQRIHELNIEHFRSLLTGEVGPEQRRVLLELLDQEREKLATLLRERPADLD